MNLFLQRRIRLCQKLDEHSIVIIVGNCAKTRSKNINYHFRPDNDLYYLSGFTEQDAVMVLRPNHQQNFVMFTRPNDEKAETNFGARAGLEGVKNEFSVDQAFAIDEIDQKLPALLLGRNKVYFLDEQEIYSARIFDWLNFQRKNSAFDTVKQYRQLLPLAPILHNDRVIKSAEEIHLIKHAVKASVSAHIKVMQSCEIGMNEYQLSAIFDREIAEFGCRDVAYPSIVASGNNACCLHYEENNSPLKDGDLLLIDAGAENQLYCSDITRTWPINGKFSEAQAQLYQVVLSAIDAAIRQIEPGLSWQCIYQTCTEYLAKGLLDLGILSGSFEQVMEDESYRQFTVHKTGHWLGLDVHDVGRYHDKNGVWVTLAANMVFTIEPGIYIPENCQGVVEKWRGIGIRIEDDILVTHTGCENLSREIPRTIKDIELLMSKV